MLFLLQNSKAFLGNLNNFQPFRKKKYSQNGLTYEKNGFGTSIL